MFIAGSFNRLSNSTRRSPSWPLLPALISVAAAAAGCSNDDQSTSKGAWGGASGASSAAAGAGGTEVAGAGRGGSGGAGGAALPPFKTDNLIINGDAENGVVGWTPVTVPAGVRAQPYGGVEFPTLADPGPADRGMSFFDGGDNVFTDSHQSIDLSALGDKIAAGARFTLSAYLGGYLTQDDRASVYVSFLAEDGAHLATGRLGGPYAAERLGKTGLFMNELDGRVPAETWSADVHIVMTRGGGNGSDGYADNLSLVLHN